MWRLILKRGLCRRRGINISERVWELKEGIYKMTIKKRIATALVSGAIVGATLLPAAALADTTCEISGNGAHSHNSCRITRRSSTRIRQSNSSTIRNSVHIWVDTGGNDANKNTGGDVSVTTGDADVNVTINNDVNQNN